MNVFLLNTNSFGGNYEYSIRLQKAYARHADVEICMLVVPENASIQSSGTVQKILISDQPRSSVAVFRKIHFLFRSIVNPLRLFFYLKKQSRSLVVFNDYEQLSSVIWVPFFLTLKQRHIFAVILHDPDRDAYFRYKWLSEITMKQVMRLMHVGLYHEVLPAKPYYTNQTNYLAVPHGLYETVPADQDLHHRLMQIKGAGKLLGIIGNIRDEKNYTAVISALPLLPADVKLVIAGAKASSSVSVAQYKKQAEDAGLTERVIWIEKYLSDAEMQAVIQSCDVILLYYKEQFTSQSGILNLIAPLHKKILVSDVSSALCHTVQHFGIGYLAPLTQKDLVDGLRQALQDPEDVFDAGWNRYMHYASWDRHAEEVLTAVKSLT